MALDDMVPDSALGKRLEAIEGAVTDLHGILALRGHLSVARTAVDIARDSIRQARGDIAEKGQPDDPINAKYRSRMRKQCILSYSGQWFFPLDPKAEEVRHVDVVQGLLHACRYAGQLPRFLSVAEHSIKVATMAEHMVMKEVAEGRLPEEAAHQAALYGLLHDAHEAYLGDLVRPIKGVIADVFGTPWERLEDNLQTVILEAYHLPPPSPEVDAAVRLADQYARYCEVLVLRDHINDPRWHHKVPPEDVLAVGAIKKAEPPRVALQGLFDQEVRRLVNRLGGRIPEVEVEPTEEPLVLRAVPPVTTPAPSRGSTWRNKVATSDMAIPPELLNEPEFKKE